MSSNRTAIITGASSGIGEATAKLLASFGINVVAGYHTNKRNAESVVLACKQKGVMAISQQVDVADNISCDAFVDEALKNFGSINYLVNSAAITKFIDHQAIEKLNANDFMEIYAVNVVGAYQMTRAFAKRVSQPSDAAIVNVSSIAASTGLGSSIAYAASKGALNTMTFSLARVFAPHIRVNAVCPGLVETPWWASHTNFAALKKTHQERTLLKDIANSKEIAEAIYFLLTSKKITGEILTIDGGFNF